MMLLSTVPHNLFVFTEAIGLRENKNNYFFLDFNPNVLLFFYVSSAHYFEPVFVPLYITVWLYKFQFYSISQIFVSIKYNDTW